MTLGEILAARADNARAREVVEIGSLGSIELEALPIQDLERLSRGADADRAVFYAASRELQSVGAALMRAGKVSRPDQVMAFVSDEEAAKAAGAVRALSGWSVAAAGLGSADGQDSHESEIRLGGVQVNAEVRQSLVQENDGADRVRPALVRERATEFDKIRPSSVQMGKSVGQASGEFLTENGEGAADAGKPQLLPEEIAGGPQNVAVSDNTDGGLRNAAEKNLSENVESADGGARLLHEMESEIGAEKDAWMHEIESESTDGMHEMKSEQRPKKAGRAHENKSELTDGVHETESESAGIVHEIESEQQRNATQTQHETTSELAERVARELLEGLRRAAWVR